MASLDAKRTEMLSNAARTIQMQIRTFIARKEFVALRKAAIQLQSFTRGTFLDCQKYHNFFLISILQYSLTWPEIMKLLEFLEDS